MAAARRGRLDGAAGGAFERRLQRRLGGLQVGAATLTVMTVVGQRYDFGDFAGIGLHHDGPVGHGDRFGDIVSDDNHRNALVIGDTAQSALNNINFEVQPGEAVAVVGRSGSGKSTLLHILSGLMLPSAGEVYIDDKLVHAPSPRWIVMFQQPHLYPWMSVEQSVGLGLKFARRSKRVIDKRVAELLSLSDRPRRQPRLAAPRN